MIKRGRTQKEEENKEYDIVFDRLQKNLMALHFRNFNFQQTYRLMNFVAA